MTKYTHRKVEEAQHEVGSTANKGEPRKSTKLGLRSLTIDRQAVANSCDSVRGSG